MIVLSSFLAFGVSSFQKSISKDDSFQKLKKLRLEVLQANSIGKDFEYDLTGQEGCSKTKLTYLGIISTSKNKKYKLLNSFFVTGYSCRGISRLVVYDDKNNYLGNYYFEGPLPSSIDKNEIVFKKGIRDCNNVKEVKISFNTGLPKSFNVCGETLTFQGDE
jgi:hypothetical protein